MIPKPYELGPGFEKFKEWRPQQDSTIQSLVDSDKDYLLLEAPTGSGKTLVGTSVHKVLHLSNTVYCCTTRFLQDQYMSDFSAFAVDVKGRNNYPCLLPGVQDASQCLDRKELPCNRKNECPYRIRVEEARKAEVAVLNTWALLFQIYYAGRFTNLTSREDEPRRELLILDEADSLEEVLVSFASQDITQKYVKKHYLPIPNFHSEDVNYWLEWVQEALDKLDALIGRAPSEEKKNELRVVQEKLKFIQKNLNDSWVVETFEGGITLVPTDISALAHQHLFRHFNRILLMSASFCGDKIFTKIMGIPKDGYDYFKVPSYFPIHKRPIYYIPVANCTQRYEQQGSYEDIIKAVDKILGTFSERTIIHTVSNDRAEQLKQDSSYPIEIYNAQDGRHNIALFREGVVRTLASPSLERGYDFPDDACRINIITKVPYLYWGSKSIQARAGKNRQWYSWQAVQKMVQMTGRSTRSASDYSISFILDSEFYEGLVQKKGGGPMFPDWWKDAIKPITLEEVTPKLLEEAKK